MNYDKYNLLMHLESRPCSGEEALASTGVISWNQVINNLTNKDAHLKKYLYFFSSRGGVGGEEGGSQLFISQYKTFFIGFIIYSYFEYLTMGCELLCIVILFLLSFFFHFC